MFSFQKGFFLALLASAEASFHRDVVRRNKQRNLERIMNKKIPGPSTTVHQELLGKALPLSEYEQKYGVDLGSAARKLNDANDNGDAADYDMISFSGYSMKFAKCQPVQYFSERALELGEHSPMITNDIVILRLCPTNSCSDSSEYGCHYNYAEYALDLTDYVRIMLQYAAAMRDNTCDYCDQCLNYGGNNNGGNNNGGNNRNLNDAGGDYDANGYDDNQQDDQDAQDEGAQNNEYQEAQQYNGANGANNYDPDEAYKYACNTWDEYCSDYGDLCVKDQNAQENQDGQGEQGDNAAAGYMDYEQYEEYLDCTQVDINEYAYFVKPRCDGYQSTIKMGIFYDKYCNQYAGNDINLKNAGLGFKESVFQDFSSNYCVDCTESDYPPYDAPNEMCNEVFYNSAKCIDDLSGDLFDNSGSDAADESTECSFIESIRFGTYNELGQLAGGLSNGSMSEQMTDNQKMILGIAIAVSSFFIVYACYLHHAMTNLLIKSLSHRELLPPSRHQNYRSRANPRRSGRQLQKVDDEPDWDDNNSAEYA